MPPITLTVLLLLSAYLLGSVSGGLLLGRLRGVDILIDGRVVAPARYGEANAGVADFWKGSTDPNHPRVYFRARVAGLSPGRHWLGLRLHGADGSAEDWPAQLVVVR